MPSPSPEKLSEVILLEKLWETLKVMHSTPLEDSSFAEGQRSAIEAMARELLRLAQEVSQSS